MFKQGLPSVALACFATQAEGVWLVAPALRLGPLGEHGQASTGQTQTRLPHEEHSQGSSRDEEPAMADAGPTRPSRRCPSLHKVGSNAVVVLIGVLAGGWYLEVSKRAAAAR